MHTATGECDQRIATNFFEWRGVHHRLRTASSLRRPATHNEGTSLRTLELEDEGRTARLFAREPRTKEQGYPLCASSATEHPADRAESLRQGPRSRRIDATSGTMDSLERVHHNTRNSIYALSMSGIAKPAILSSGGQDSAFGSDVLRLNVLMSSERR